VQYCPYRPFADFCVAIFALAAALIAGNALTSWPTGAACDGHLIDVDLRTCKLPLPEWLLVVRKEDSIA